MFSWMLLMARADVARRTAAAEMFQSLFSWMLLIGSWPSTSTSRASRFQSLFSWMCSVGHARLRPTWLMTVSILVLVDVAHRPPCS